MDNLVAFRMQCIYGKFKAEQVGEKRCRDKT